MQLPDQSPVNFKSQSWQQRRQALSQIQQWNIDGAFSIQQPHQNAIAAYEWQQKGLFYHIRIRSSLDAYSVDITGQPGFVTLWQGASKRYTAPSPEQLMQQQLRWQLPISNLYYWIRGLPASGKYHAVWDAYGHLIALNQQGWQIHYGHYWPSGPVDLPQILDLTHSTLRIRIVIKHWTVE